MFLNFFPIDSFFKFFEFIIISDRQENKLDIINALQKIRTDGECRYAQLLDNIRPSFPDGVSLWQH